MNLSQIKSIPGVLQAAIADDAGRLLDCIGDVEPPTAAVLVLAHATLSAAAELGRRSGSGDCLEIIQQHEGGAIYLHGMPQRRVLLVRCQNIDAIPFVRAASQNLAKPITTRIRPVSTPSHDLADALHAEPAW
ncbi:roadblock/LC7 domain-containing protein [Prosthecobacter sp.]|uniref:roadblock/LC7 domain-containing protein n=1 Tax=Prosthecobacter sp. TaxID=1965333 RepID=UPI001D1C85DA|nr:roadblock/LC7 domain-containing protein [Prosthecobacter sp.]MCB1276179.1 roadblock/LC7 domain-containing protein [Prosthecobacter sp.]